MVKSKFLHFFAVGPLLQNCTLPVFGFVLPLVHCILVSPRDFSHHGDFLQKTWCASQEINCTRTQLNPPERSVTPNLSLQILFTQILKKVWRRQDKFCAVDILNCVKLTQASLAVCVPIWLFDALLCFCWLSFLCFPFMFLVRRETPVWMIIKNAEKQRKKERGGRWGGKTLCKAESVPVLVPAGV